MQRLRTTAWLMSVAAAGIFIAYISVALQRAGVAPLLLVPLLAGAVLGTASICSALQFQVSNRQSRIAGTLVGAVLLIASQHLALYFHHVRDWKQAHREQPDLSLFRDPAPQPVWNYLAQEAADGRWWLWLLDGAIVTATSVGLVAGVQLRHGETNID